MFRALALTAGVLTFTAAAEAGPLGLAGPKPGAADIYTGGLDISYDAATGLFTAMVEGIGNYNPGFSDIKDLTYSLSASVDSTGALSGGHLEVFGSIADLGLGSTGAPISLLTGTVTDFGSTFETGFSVFELLFEVDSKAAGLGFGTKGGIILSSWDLSGASFASSFESTMAMGAGDTYAVPEPSTLLLLTLGAAGAAARRRYLATRV